MLQVRQDGRNPVSAFSCRDGIFLTLDFIYCLLHPSRGSEAQPQWWSQEHVGEMHAMNPLLPSLMNYGTVYHLFVRPHLLFYMRWFFIYDVISLYKLDLYPYLSRVSYTFIQARDITVYSSQWDASEQQERWFFRSMEAAMPKQGEGVKFEEI